MGKRILDIIPPKKLKRKEKKILLSEEKKWSLPKISTLHLRKELIFFLILIGIFCYFVLPKAEIEIQPESEILTPKITLTVDKQTLILDVTSQIIPGKIFEADKAVLEEFSSSGTKLKEEKAEGIIRVYNAYSTSPQTLIARTRFVSTEGKLFRLVERVIIPGGHYEEGNFVPGFLDVKVQADQPGPEFNIGPTTFSIPGFAGTPRYTAFYGKSFQPMTGGIEEEVSQVTQEDLDLAKEVMLERVKEECKLTLKEKIPPEFVLLDETVKSEIFEVFSSALVQEETGQFIFKVEAHSEALLFKRKDIEEWITQFILSQTPEGKKLYQESLKINYSPETIDLESGQMTLSLTTEAKIYSDLDEDTVKEALSGKSLAEAQLFLGNHPKITRAFVRLWPFWVREVPKNKEKIDIFLNLD